MLNEVYYFSIPYVTQGQYTARFVFMENPVFANDETITMSIFPALEGKKARYINMNECALSSKKQPARSRYLDADLTDRALARLHHRWGVEYSFGGYLEDRRDLWRGSYLNPEKAVHVAIDVNIPADTALTVKYPGTVTKIIHDHEQDGGWGGVIMFRLDKPIGRISHFLYAHLAKGSVKHKEGDAVSPGDIVGLVGRCHENGGWYEHLHVQAMTQEAWDLFKGDLSKFDGYAPQVQGNEHPYFPEPSALL
jgi:murein DD-endopeptidase MepM/ murein hydrolase activator NlpD